MSVYRLIKEEYLLFRKKYVSRIYYFIHIFLQFKLRGNLSIELSKKKTEFLYVFNIYILACFTDHILNNINIHRFFISIYKIQISYKTADLGCQCEFCMSYDNSNFQWPCDIIQIMKCSLIYIY